MLTLPHHGSADQNDRQQRHIIDDLHDRDVAFFFEVWIEERSDCKVDRALHLIARLAKKSRDFTADDFLNIVGADTSLRHGRGVDENLECWRAAS